jgi:cobalt/nickel transport system permease protein
VHIPDGFLSGGVIAATWAVSATGVGAALRAEKSDPNPMPAGILGATAAFLFAAQLVNVPVAPGMSGHLVGATLAAALLGPWRAVIAMSVVLAIQAVLFQDGGVGALGANLLDMGVVGVATGYAVAIGAARIAKSPRGLAIGCAVGAFAATLAAATLTGLWLGLSGLYPIRGIVPVMLVSHVVIGVLEAGLTGAIVVTVLRWRPDLVRGVNTGRGVSHPGAALVGMLGIAVVIAAFVSPFASSLPDGFEAAAERLGVVAHSDATWPAPFSEYTLPFTTAAGVATALAGVLGTLAAAGVAWLVSRGLRSDPDAIHR